MGNVASCAPSIISSGSVKVLFNDGRLEIYRRPVKAEELILENPGQFVCDSGQLSVGHRILGLSGDEKLERRQLYLLLPLEMLYSVLTYEEMASLADKTTTALEREGGSLNFSKIFPVVLGDFCIFPNNNNNPQEHNNNNNNPEAAAEKHSSQRSSWKPALETIIETPPRST